MGFIRRGIKRVLLALILWCFAIPAAFLSSCVRFLLRVLSSLFHGSSSIGCGGVIVTPDECFAGLEQKGFPFKPNYVSLKLIGREKPLRVHYIDEGRNDVVHQETILCLHGEPSWCYLYRKLVPGCVTAGMRVIALDFIGFGKSDKFLSQDDYSHELHRQTLLAFVEKMELTNVTLVVQDWGGLTGLSCVRHFKPEVISRLVIMNTGLPTGKEILAGMNMVLGHPFILWMCFVRILGQNLPISAIFQAACKTPRADAAPYAAPFPSSKYKAGAAKWPLLVPIHESMEVAGDMRASREFLRRRWADKPCLIMFGNRDPVTKGANRDFLSLMPAAKEVTVEGAGHFLQETHGEFLASEIVKFVHETKTSSAFHSN